jgi:hypothetical protein
VFGSGPVTGVRVNGRKWKRFDNASVTLPYDQTPKEARVEIQLGNTPSLKRKPARVVSAAATGVAPVVSQDAALAGRLARVAEFHRRLVAARLGESYEAAHAKLVLDCAQAQITRRELASAGKLPRLPEASEAAANQCYADTVTKLYAGLEATLAAYRTTEDAAKTKMLKLWEASAGAPGARRK